jgi:hypothetical protein
MNTRIKLAFIRSLNKNPGFALPLALMIGLVMLTIGIGMIARTQGDQSKVTSQKIKADGLSVAEVAVTQVQQLIDENRLLSMYDSTNWSNSEVQTALRAAIDEEQAHGCNNNSDNNSDSSRSSTTTESILNNISSIADTTKWTNLPNNRSYRLVSYDYSGTEGRIEGVNDNVTKAYATLDGRAGADQGLSQTRLEVEIPVISQRDPIFVDDRSIPGLWLAEGTTDDRGYPVGYDGTYTRGANFKSNVVMSDRCSYPKFQQRAITNFITEERILEDINTRYNARFVVEKFPQLPAMPTDLPASQQNLSITGDMTFPRSGDVASTKRTIGYEDPNDSANNVDPQDVPVYEYIVTSINLSGGKNITITPDSKVIFYLQGNIGGNGNINHVSGDCPSSTRDCKPMNFQIFAYNTSNSNNPEICLKGNSRLDAFIFAPDYLIGKTEDVQYYGSIWGKSWGKIANCGSNNDSSNPSSFIQRGLWSSLYNDLKPAVPLPRIGQVINWQEVPIN